MIDRTFYSGAAVLFTSLCLSVIALALLGGCGIQSFAEEEWSANVYPVKESKLCDDMLDQLYADRAVISTQYEFKDIEAKHAHHVDLFRIENRIEDTWKSMRRQGCPMPPPFTDEG